MIYTVDTRFASVSVLFSGISCAPIPFDAAIPNLFDDFPLFDVGEQVMMPLIQARTGKAEFKETPTELAIDVKLPGYATNDVHVKVSKEGVLTISAQKSGHREDDREGRQVKESYSSSYTRSFQLPENALREQIHAELERGRMKIVVPKDAKME